MQSDTNTNTLSVPVADSIDNFLLTTGRWFSWANFILILVTILQVVLRYGFRNGLVTLEELEWHLYGFAFMMGLSYALITNSHVRVDVIQSRFSRKTREWIDIIGHIFLLLPFIVTVIYFGWEFTYKSFVLSEHSNAPMGLPYRWIIKSVVPISFAFLGLATISRIIRSFAIIRSEKHGSN
ncbi:MAG: C4-dicarboxylate ABC transporter [Denitrovibrio sp.]|nr:MAG: C4-dicarboxylate ABC transporter [Denitrovibrio sp.]